MKLREITRDSQNVYSGIVVNIRMDKAELQNGRIASREVVEHPGGVAVLPLHDDGTVTVVRQFRYPFSEVLTEIPAGKLERGEDPLCAALRELREETGITAGEVTPLGVLYPSPGYCGEVLHLYLARSLTTGEAQPDPDEFLEILRLPLDTLAEQAVSGAISDAKTVAAILKTKMILSSAR